MFAQSENQGSQEGVTDPQEQSNLPSDPAAPEVPAAQEFAETSPENSATEPAPAGPVDPVAAMDGVAEAAEALKSEFFGGDSALDRLNDVQLDVRVELGRSRMLVDDVLRLGSGSVVEGTHGVNSWVSEGSVAINALLGPSLMHVAPLAQKGTRKRHHGLKDARPKLQKKA